MNDEPVLTEGLTELQPFKGSTIAQIVIRRCDTCEFSATEKPDLVCRRLPPTQTFLALPIVQPGLPGRPPQQGIQIKPWGGFPITRPDAWCGEFKKR